ncbi:MAG: cell division protein ZapA [Fibrobacter sp.]|nr:cell division protein ZapA [Fibrobacter sp.]
MSESKLKPIRINVGNERLQIQTDLTEEELNKLSAYVENKMEVHINPALRVDPRKQFILLAMDITAELFNTKARLKKSLAKDEKTQTTISHLLEILEDLGDSGNIPSDIKISEETPPFLEP